MEYKTIGFWKNDEKYLSSRLLKQSMPAHCRLCLVKNKYKRKGDNLPTYVGYLIPANSESSGAALTKHVKFIPKDWEDREDDIEHIASVMYNFFRDREEYIIDAFRNGIDTRHLDFEIRTYLEKNL